MERSYDAAIEALTGTTGDRHERMQRVVDVLWDALHSAGISWVGFYECDGGDEMILGPRRDKPACSPIGMHPKEDDSLVPAEMFREPMVVFDAVYNPRRTRLLYDAQAAGCRTIEGIEMFLGQAYVQFELWTGRQAPRDVMRRVVEEKL